MPRPLNPDGSSTADVVPSDPGNTVQIVAVKAGLVLPVSGSFTPAGTGDSRIVNGETEAVRVIIRSQVQRAAEQAKVYFAGSGPLSLSVAGNIRATITNPGTETTNIHLIRISGLATAAAWGRIRVNPITGLPVSAGRPVNNNILGQAADGTVLKVDTDPTVALAGGTDTGVILGIPSATRYSVDLPVPIVIAPGVALGLAIPFTGAADATITMYWYRTPLVA